MRRLLRILLNALTVLSLLLCLAGAALWVRSYVRNDNVRWTRPAGTDGRHPFFDLGSGGGGITVHIGMLSAAVVDDLMCEGWRWWSDANRPVRYGGSWGANRVGFGYDAKDSADGRWRGVTFPLWLPTVLFASLPLARGALYVRRRRRKREGHCPRCGYDLRATPDRCPECGTVSPAVGHAASA